MSCPGCDAHSSLVTEAFTAGRPCPYCRLSAASAAEVLAVREAQADGKLKATAEEALLRAGRAESELRTARYRLERAGEVLREALAEEVPDWWEPS
jgi:hypothetical protein